MIQGQGRLVTDRVVPVFGRGVWLTGFQRVAVLPDVPGAGTGSRPRRGGLLPVAGTGGWSGAAVRFHGHKLQPSAPGIHGPPGAD